MFSIALFGQSSCLLPDLWITHSDECYGLSIIVCVVLILELQPLKNLSKSGQLKKNSMNRNWKNFNDIFYEWLLAFALAHTHTHNLKISSKFWQIRGEKYQFSRWKNSTITKCQMSRWTYVRISDIQIFFSEIISNTKLKHAKLQRFFPCDFI